jgi:sigma-B regulation protein RsbU (phosphoserine phosphatase)
MSEEKLRRLQTVTDAALSQLGLEDLLDELLERTRDLLSADTAAVLLLDSTGTELVATAASGLEQGVRQGVRLPVGQGFAGTVAERGEPVVVEHADRNDVASILGVPMFSAGRVIGVLHVGTLRRRRFTPDDVELLQLVADRASLATQARLSRLDRATTLALQRSLLPSRPPAVAGLDVAARYVPGAEVGVGGDWYDLFALPSGHVGIAIGDVAGNGLHAAIVMGRIRSALRAYALETPDPADVLTRLDRKIQLFEPGALATAAYAVVDPSRATLSLSVAGHLPPILIDPDQPARPLTVAADLPLGAYPNAPRRHTTMPVPAAMLLYTDGLIERRDRPLRDAITELAATLTFGTAEHLCTQSTALLGQSPTTDDVALIALRRI